MMSRNMKRDDRPRIPPSSNDKIRGQRLESGRKAGTYNVPEHISENFSVKDRAAGRLDGSRLNILEIRESSRDICA